MIMRRVKNLLSVRLAWMLSAKFRIVRSQVPPSGEETGRQNYLRQLSSPILCRTKKGYQLQGNVLGLQRQTYQSAAPLEREKHCYKRKI
ncbi:hypothetical protein TNCV_4070091 [Trichonephila clavipes]|nr:hypothetical protein TNCV_4070091 [Trichonephila clavipes]